MSKPELEAAAVPLIDSRNVRGALGDTDRERCGTEAAVITLRSVGALGAFDREWVATAFDREFAVLAAGRLRRVLTRFALAAGIGVEPMSLDAIGDLHRGLPLKDTYI